MTKAQYWLSWIAGRTIRGTDIPEKVIKGENLVI